MNNAMPVANSAGLYVTSKCTLRCKLCSNYTPYHQDYENIGYTEISKVLENLFQTGVRFNFLGIFGGEPLLHKELDKILIRAFSYSEHGQIGKVLIISNGTLLPQEPILSLLKQNKERCLVKISDYGSLLSKKSEEFRALLNSYDIPNAVLNYHGLNLHCDGWVDFNDHSLKFRTPGEVEKQGRGCALRKNGFYIERGKMYLCARSFWRISQGIIPDNPDEYLDLLDESSSPVEKRMKMTRMLSLVSTTACAYCYGLRADAPRYPPAEQLS
jgi:hypothetical protein